jgi:phage terminase small subunit
MVFSYGLRESMTNKKDKKALTPKQARFVDEYLVDMNATQAAIRAGYSAKTANPAAARLLVNVSISEEIQSRRNKLAKKSEVDAQYVIDNLVSTLRKASGIDPIPGDDGEDIYRFNGAVANKSLELLGKNLGLFTDKLEVKTDFTFQDLWIMARSRKRDPNE